MKIFVSNHVEQLADLLKEELFQEESHPFDKRWVIVPNERVKQDLYLKWAHDPLMQVATGFKMITWYQAVSRIFPEIPSQLELSLKIEAALKEIENAEPLLAYLNHGGFKRKASLCDKMSTLFLQYLNQPEEKLLRWLEKDGWQQSLWRSVFGSEFPWKNKNLLEGSVYLFHPFQASHYELAALQQMQATCFLFSPCAMYWGDFHTLQEQRYLLKRAQLSTKKELLDFFETEHPLLANWGKKGRQLLSLFEDEEWRDVYERPDPHSLLQIVQEEMLTLSVSEKIPDSSIQVHSTPSKLREVEVVWEIIQRLPFKPSEILVLAPEMKNYAPFVELVFRQRGGPFDFAIFCLEARAKSPLIQGLEALLELPRYRFSKEAVEKLLLCPPFLKKFDLTITEAHLLLKWMNEVHIRYDLKGNHPGTWKEGLQRLVEALISTVRDNQPVIDFSEADVLSKLIAIIDQFQTIDEKERSLKEWSKTLKELINQFFSSDLDDDLTPELQKLQQIDIEGTFPFSSLERVLSHIFGQKSGAVQGSHLQAVRFASLEKGALIPAKAIILMGMEEGSFPRQDSPSSLQQMPMQSRTEEDKYLFLEAFCSAREMLIITYLRIHPEDGKSQKPSPVVEELARYCSHLPIIEHPFSPLDRAYFQHEGFRSFSQAHFEALHQAPIPEAKIPHLPSIPFPMLEIRKLRQLARHPLEFFFEERIGIDFEWKESPSEFVLSPLEMIRLRKASLKKPLGELLLEMEKAGKLPVGSFSKAAVEKIRDEIETYHAQLAKLQIHPAEIYSIELKTFCKQPTQIDGKTWIYPALQIHDTLIQGRIDEISSQGVIFHGEDTLADQLKAWPLVLILRKLGLPHHLLLTKKGKISELKFAEDSLEKYLRYAEKALTMPSPLYPKWAKDLFKEGKIPTSEEDEIITWARERNLLPSAESWLKEWSPYFQEVFYELL